MTSSAAVPEPIRVITGDADLRGWVHSEGHRMTDILQAGQPFLFIPEGGDPSQWIEILPDETLLIVPPPYVSEPTLRLPTIQHQVVILADPYRVAGTAHLRPGEQDDPIMRATRRFLPLTQATFGRDEDSEESADVVIVNLRRTSEFNFG
jgi:hypothetical protein